MTSRLPAAATRRRFVLAVMAAFALTIFFLVPGYLASRPSFFGRLPALSAKYQPWSRSTHREVSCEACHVPPEAVAQSVYRVRMVGEFYLSLAFRSRAPRVFAPPTNDACLACHSDLRTVSPKGDLQIPHRAHISVLKMKCIECHDYLVHEKSPEGAYAPSMAACLRCHNGDTAKNACTACHTEKAAPVSHRAKDWVIVHAKRANDPECTGCHKWAANWCADCHAKRPRSHTSDWRTTHGLQVRAHRSCEACHTGPFCTRCHGEVPKLNFNPTLHLVK